ncbi:hypothetical protein M2T32_27915, partial [Klebsiella pneumoniae]|uniref:hypothetical protein n=1 Tax=Klebsiella pneumoniae TaxID=573 RepID=UPI00200E8105
MPGSTILFDAGLDQQSIALLSPLVINKDLNINTDLQVDINGSVLTSSVFNIAENKHVRLGGLHIQCASAGDGRCIDNHGVL